MQFYDPILYKCICEIRYKPKFIYYNKRLDICEKFQNKLPNWKISIGGIEFNDSSWKEEDRRNIFNFTNKGASLDTRNTDVYENFKFLA